MNINRLLIVARFVLLIVVFICHKYKLIGTDTALVIMLLLMVWSLVNFIKQRKANSDSRETA